MSEWERAEPSLLPSVDALPPHVVEELGASANGFLLNALSHSPYLTRIALAHKDFVQQVFASKPADLFEVLCAETIAAGTQDDQAALMSFLRTQKKRVAFLIALADLGGLWSVEDVMHANTRFADACVQASVQHLLRAEPSIENKTHGGLVVLAMGKYGARELNYSSDIDIIIFYESQSETAVRVYPKLVRGLVRLLNEMTADGYVFRVDLSLRPDPGTTQVAISIPAAHAYYESVGQNWERAAFIKARVVAGESVTAKKFLQEMGDFIWRKYLDYAVLQDIYAMKRQTHTAIGWDEKTTTLDGRDIKRAAGGIRDIEMFVQSQQLIAGGRDPLLRQRKTCQMLARLAARDWISRATATELIAAYRFFRMVEHRLQMIADEQTHTLPRLPESWQQLALFCGFSSVEAFQARLMAEMTIVRSHYGELFKQAEGLGGDSGALVFTGGEDDPETLTTLAAMGFSDGAFIASLIRAWHRGRIPAATSPRARELLTELVPQFLERLTRAKDPQGAFVRLDRFLSGLHSGVQFFSLLRAQPEMIELIILICDTAPRLANDLAKTPKRIEALFSPPPDDLAEDLENYLQGAKGYEYQLDLVRAWVGEVQFYEAIQILKNNRQGLESAKQFSRIAAVAISALQKSATADFNKRKGEAKGEMVILAAGSLGAQEMTIISDIDMIFIYEEGGDQNYATGLAQNILRALTTQTAQGGLFEVDMRLRPSGNSGPVAIGFDAFYLYQKNQAWVWEHMALTRMRPLGGTGTLRAKLAESIKEILTQPRDIANLKKEVLAMRGRIAEARAPKGLWDISASRGGLVDVEFICQYLQLAHAAQHPQILHHATLDAFNQMIAAGLGDELAELCAAAVFFKQVVQLFYLSLGRIGADEEVPAPLRALVAGAVGAQNWAEVCALRDKHYENVRRQFALRIGDFTK